MDTASLTTNDRARKNFSVALQRISSVGLGPVSKAVGVSESTISRMKDGDLERFSAVLAACGLKVVPVEAKCYNPDHIGHILELAKVGMNRMSPDSLEFDD